MLFSAMEIRFLLQIRIGGASEPRPKYRYRIKPQSDKGADLTTWRTDLPWGNIPYETKRARKAPVVSPVQVFCDQKWIARP